MGWQLKGLAFIVALVAIPFGAWFVTIPLLFYVISGFIPRRKKQQQIVTQLVPPQGQDNNPPYAPPHSVQSVQLGPPPKPRYSRKSIVRYILGGLFLTFGLTGVNAGGTFSPVMFGGLGLLFIFWSPFSKVAGIYTLKPVPDSILLRAAFPFMWVAMAEVKLATQQPTRPLSAISEKLLIIASERPSAYLTVQRLALSHRSAEEKVLERMREVAKAMAPLGAYLLPLDSSKAAERLNVSLEELNIDPEKWKQNLSMVHYDVLAIESKEGYVESFSAYVKDGKKTGVKPHLPSVGKNPSRPPLLWEVLHPVDTRVRWANPDEYTSFLSSIAATENATVGERVTDMGSANDSQILRVRSTGGPTVELSRAELRAIVRIYSPRVKEGAVQIIFERMRVPRVKA